MKRSTTQTFWNVWKATLFTLALICLGGCALPYDEPLPGDATDVRMMKMAYETSILPASRRILDTAAAPQAANRLVRDGVLRLEDCIDHAISANLDLHIVDARTDAATERITQARAAFDPVFSGDIGAGGGGESGFRAEKRFASGTEFRVEDGFLTNRGGQFSDDSNTTNSDSVAFRIRQPLLSGAGWQENSIGIRRATIDSTKASAEAKAELLEVLRKVELTYRATAAASRILVSQRASLERTQKIRGQIKERVDVGNATNLDLLEAEAAVTRARERLVRADQRYEDGLDQLWFVLGLPVGERVPGLKLAPMPLDTLEAGGLDSGKRYADALRRSPTAVLLANQLHRADLELYSAKREALPRLDLELSSQPLSGDNLAGQNDWSGLVYFSIPWTLREGRAKVREAKSELAASALTREQGERQLKVDILNTVRAVKANQQQVAAAEDSSDVNRQKWEEQLKRFNEGLVSVRLLMEAEDEYQAAEIQAVEAKLLLAASWLTLARLDGSIADLNGVKL